VIGASHVTSGAELKYAAETLVNEAIWETATIPSAIRIFFTPVIPFVIIPTPYTILKMLSSISSTRKTPRLWGVFVLSYFRFNYAFLNGTPMISKKRSASFFLKIAEVIVKRYTFYTMPQLEPAQSTTFSRFLKNSINYGLILVYGFIWFGVTILFGVGSIITTNKYGLNIGLLSVLLYVLFVILLLKIPARTLQKNSANTSQEPESRSSVKNSLLCILSFGFSSSIFLFFGGWDILFLVPIGIFAISVIIYFVSKTFERFTIRVTTLLTTVFVISVSTILIRLSIPIVGDARDKYHIFEFFKQLSPYEEIIVSNYYQQLTDLTFMGTLIYLFGSLFLIKKSVEKNDGYIDLTIKIGILFASIFLFILIFLPILKI
jgi:hypothetical protein